MGWMFGLACEPAAELLFTAGEALVDDSGIG